MLEQENVLRDFLISTLSEASTFAGWLHIAAGDILPVENLLENMIWTLLEKKPGVNQLNQTTMGLLLQNLTLFAENINRYHAREPGRKRGFFHPAVHRDFLPGRYVGGNRRPSAHASLCFEPVAEAPHRRKFQATAPAAQIAAGGLFAY